MVLKLKKQLFMSKSKPNKKSKVALSNPKSLTTTDPTMESLYTKVWPTLKETQMLTNKPKSTKSSNTAPFNPK